MTEVLQIARMQSLHRGTRAATVVGAIVILSLLFLAALFPLEAAGAVRVWIVSPTFNHCFLILPLSLFVIWQRREAICAAQISPAVWAPAAVLACSLIWLVTLFADVLEAKQFVIVTMLQTALFAILGWRLYGKLAGPLLYLYFLVPSGAFLIPVLQAFTARFAVAGLHVLGIPVFSTGAVIEIPAGTFAIAEACAGLRFLIASVAFGVFFAMVTYRSVLRRAVFIALSLIVPVVANGFRALGLIAAAQWIGSPAAALADHIIYGWIFFSIVLVILVVIGNLFSDRKSATGTQMQLERELPRGSVPLGRMGVVAAICAIVSLTGPLAAAAISIPKAVALPRSAPRVSSPWKQLEAEPDWRPVLANPSRTFADTFLLGRHKVDRFIALYEGNSRRSNLIRSANRDADERVWTFNSSAAGELSVGGRSFPVRISTWLRGPEKRKVWSFYVVNGRAIASLFLAKLVQVEADLRGNPCISAYVSFSVEGVNRMPDASGVAKLLAASKSFKPYLCRSR